jgi:hypothetical protein
LHPARMETTVESSAETAAESSTKTAAEFSTETSPGQAGTDQAEPSSQRLTAG